LSGGVKSQLLEIRLRYVQLFDIGQTFTLYS